MESNNKSRLIPAGIIFPFILITSLFFLWGVANNMTDTLLAAFKRIMSMTDSQTALIQVVFYGAGYGLLAIPAAIFIKKYSYKAGVLLGLGLYSIGAMLFFPAKLTADYYWFLAAIWILSGGLSILETAANPYILSMGSDETGTRRLNLAQSFNPIGSITGILLSQQFILSKLNKANAIERAAMNPENLQRIQNGELNAVTITYVTLGLLLIIIWILIATNRRMPKTSEAGGPLNFGSTFRRLLHKKHYVWGVVAQFFYVGAQIGVWSFTIRYAMKELRFEEIELPVGKTPEQMAATYYLASLILFTISRFVCTWLMKFIAPARLLTILAGLAVVFTIMVIYIGGEPGVYALIGISGCMSLMFPTIFGLACRGLGEDTKLAGSGLILAIFGGAVFTQLQGVVSDITGNINLAFWVPLCCFIVIAYYGIIARRCALN
jgi:FHS family L-fucose permease-like MFS transporter